MAHSKPQLNWKSLKWLYRQEQSSAISTTEIVRALSSTDEVKDMIRNDILQEKVPWENLCVLINLSKVLLIHAQSGSDLADASITNLVLSEGNEFLKFVVAALQTKFNSR